VTANILDLLEDVNVFKPHFKGPSWDGWKAFLVTLFALPLSDSQLACYRQCTGRVAPPSAPFSEAA
jgi:hypothetical protein